MTSASAGRHRDVWRYDAQWIQILESKVYE